MNEQTVTLTAEQMRELQAGRGCLRGSIQVTRAATGEVENYEIELRPLPPEQENSNG